VKKSNWKAVFVFASAIAAISLSACSGESPLSPTPLPTVQPIMNNFPDGQVIAAGINSTASAGTSNPANVFSTNVVNGGPSDATRVIFYYVGKLDRVRVKNLSDKDHRYTFAVWEFHSETNQTLVKASSAIIPSGEVQDLTVDLQPKCNTTYQPDVYVDNPGSFTTFNDVQNYKFLAPGVLWHSDNSNCPTAPVCTTDCTPVPPCTTNCTPPPPSCPAGYTGTPPNCIPPPACPSGYAGTYPNCIPPPSDDCSFKSFSRRSTMIVTGDVAHMNLQLAPGYDNVTVYFMAYGSKTRFPADEFGKSIMPTWPQHRVYLEKFVIRAGPAQTISLLVARNYPWLGYQNDASCKEGPEYLPHRGLNSPLLGSTSGNNPAP
jgi:hypothetical protein